MANPAFETVADPYTAFRFEVVLELDESISGVASPVCNAAFAECDGLEMTMEPKTFREGGNNAQPIHRIGPTSYGQLTLRRGITDNLDLWTWFAAAATPGRVSTAKGQVTLWDADGTPRLTFALTGCLPIKVRGPSLNAKDGQVAIEEMQLVYSGLSVRPAGQGGGGGIGFSASASASIGGGLSASASASVGGSLSAGVSASVSAELGIG